MEDPDIWVDEKNIKHLYFTIAFNYKEKRGYKIYLGHAQGKELDKLTATKPVIENNKEIAISPIKNKGYTYVLAESWANEPEEGISLLKAKDMSKNWEFKGLVFDSKKKSFPWCARYASPCRIIDSPYTNTNNLLLGICTGQAENYLKWGKKYRGYFKPGLFLFNPKTGEIPWIDSEPLFKDPDAKIITLASEFIPLSKEKGMLYCHIDDGFVRAYEINLKELGNYVKKKIKEVKLG